MSVISGSSARVSSVTERRGSMSDQPLLCKPALEREVTESLNIVNPDFATHLTSTANSLPSNSGRRVIKSSGRNYGSFTNTACTDSFFQHQVQPGETLQAISLKYNISIEQLKRINRLFSNEAFFLKEQILIPCPDIIPIDMPLVSQDGATSLLDEIQVIERKPKQQLHTKDSSRHESSSSPRPIVASSQHKNHSSKSSTQAGKRQHGTDGVTAQNGYSDPNSENEACADSNRTPNGIPSSPNISDIFSRFDTALATTKSNVEKLTQNSCITPYVAAQQKSSSREEDTFGGNYRSRSPIPDYKFAAGRGNHKNYSKKSNIVNDDYSAGEAVSLFPESKRHDELYKL